MKDYLKELLGWSIEKKLENSHNVSSQLMQQCVRQDKTVFDERKLEELDPRYKKVLLEMLDKLVSPELKNVKDTRIVVDLALGARDKVVNPTRADLAAYSNAIDNTNNLNKPTGELTEQDLKYDLARALGHVQVSYGRNGVIITDEFDFKGQGATTAKTLYEAVRQKIKFDSNTGMYTAIGHVFCKEKDGKPTESSIPVKITLNAEELGALKPVATSSNSSVFGTQRH